MATFYFLDVKPSYEEVAHATLKSAKEKARKMAERPIITAWLDTSGVSFDTLTTNYRLDPTLVNLDNLELIRVYKHDGYAYWSTFWRCTTHAKTH